MKDLLATVKQNTEIAENIYKMTLTLPESAGALAGGQFVNLATGDGLQLLRRPLGICLAEGKDITVCYQLKGKGTQKLAEAKAGDRLKILLPLGNGFNLGSAKNIAVIGGGVGVFPLIYTMRKNQDRNFYTYFGFRNKKAVCLLNEVPKCKQFSAVTDDGSYGEKDNAVNAFFKAAPAVDLIIACGPPIMLKALKEGLSERNDKTPCLVSLEERMGCGIGACLVCTCKKSDGGNARVCKDGPVFDIDKVVL